MTDMITRLFGGCDSFSRTVKTLINHDRVYMGEMELGQLFLVYVMHCLKCCLWSYVLPRYITVNRVLTVETNLYQH